MYRKLCDKPLKSHENSVNILNKLILNLKLVSQASSLITSQFPASLVCENRSSQSLNGYINEKISNTV